VGTSEPTLRAAVVGVGHLGRHHARLMAGVPGVQLAAVVDAREDQARTVAGPLGTAALTDLAELPDDVRVASVAVPTSRHHEVVCALLERGVHVLVEKPMAATLDEARAMARLAADRGLVLHVGHVERFNPALAVLHDMDLRPRFIEAHRLAPFTYRALDTSVVMDLMIHDIDIVMDLAGAPLARVDAVGSNVLGRHTDLANARLTFGNGCVANLTASRVSFEPMRRTRLFGADAFVSLDFGARRAFIVSKAPGFDIGSLGPESAGALPPKASFREFLEQGLMTLREVDMDGELNPLQEELGAFVAAVRARAGGAAPAARPARGAEATDGLRAMEVALQITGQIAGLRWD
jgi:predicted dehydrogenase